MKNWDKWERFQEVRLEKMKAHKYNIERRQQNENMDNWTYWWHHRNKCGKDCQEKKTLDPSWYTDNIYSNQSLDLDKEYLPDRPATKCRSKTVPQHTYKLSNIEDEVLFNLNAKPKTPNFGHHHQYRYPKSKSCCFGGSFDRPKMIECIPKSHTFCTARASANFAKIREIKHTYDSGRMIQSHISHGECYRDECCLEQEINRCSRNNSFQDDSHVLRKRKMEIVPNRSKADYIKNDWLRKNTNKNITGCSYDKNKNFCDFYASGTSNRSKNQMDDHHHQQQQSQQQQRCYFDDDFLCAEDDEDNANAFDEFDHQRRGSTYHTTDFDRYLEDSKRSSMMLDDQFDDVFLDDYPSCTPATPIIRNKTMLEVKAPSRYDETSSDSTDMELDDFNFDFKKYWEDLDKNDNFLDDVDQQNNNNYNNLNVKHVKEKNVNIGKYNNGSLIDDCNIERTNARYLLHKNNINTPYELPLSPILSRRSEDFGIDYIDHSSYIPSMSRLPLNRLGRNSCTDRSVYNNFYTLPGPSHGMPAASFGNHNNINNNYNQDPHHPHHHNNNNMENNNSSAISLINNIFSIYKPKKYSPVNCHSQQFSVNNSKSEPCKKMNVPSTIRPLGAPQNEFITSMKRPLLVSSSSSSIDQPNFKIIPQKTGLKISPLYRFDFCGDDKFKLKSTARPLLFPH